MVVNGLENKLEETNERGFLEKVLDGSGAAIGTSMVTKSLLTGVPGYTIALAYLVPYIGFKVGKYIFNIVKSPLKNLSLKGLGNVLYDIFSNIFPYKDRVPATVGVVSAGINYMI